MQEKEASDVIEVIKVKVTQQSATAETGSNNAQWTWSLKTLVTSITEIIVEVAMILDLVKLKARGAHAGVQVGCRLEGPVHRGTIPLITRETRSRTSDT